MRHTPLSPRLLYATDAQSEDNRLVFRDGACLTATNRMAKDSIIFSRLWETLYARYFIQAHNTTVTIVRSVGLRSVLHTLSRYLNIPERAAT